MPLTRSLQPTCCQRAPLVPTYSRARGSHLADRPRGTPPSPSTLVLRSDEAHEAGAGWPEGISDPEWRRNLVSRAPVVAFARPVPGGTSGVVLTSPGCCQGPPSFLGEGVNPCAGVFSLCTGRTMRPRTLHVAPHSVGSWVRRARRGEPRTPSTTAHQCRRFPGPKRLPSTGPFRIALLLALRARLPGRH